MGIFSWLKKVFGRKPVASDPSPLPPPLDVASPAPPAPVVPPPEDPIAAQERVIAEIEKEDSHATEMFCQANIERMHAQDPVEKAKWAKEYDRWFEIHRGLKARWVEEFSKLQKMKAAAAKPV